MTSLLVEGFIRFKPLRFVLNIIMEAYFFTVNNYWMFIFV